MRNISLGTLAFSVSRRLLWVSMTAVASSQNSHPYHLSRNRFQIVGPSEPGKKVDERNWKVAPPTMKLRHFVVPGIDVLKVKVHMIKVNVCIATKSPSGELNNYMIVVPTLAEGDDSDPIWVSRIDVSAKLRNIFKAQECWLNSLFERLWSAQKMRKRVCAPSDVQREQIAADVDENRV